MDKITARTALSDFSPVFGTHSLKALPLVGKINLRGNAKNAQFNETIQSVLGLPLPIKANTVNHTDDKALFWLGPDEWLAHVSLETTLDTMAAMRSSIGDTPIAITDVSDYFSVIELSGQSSRRILASSSPFDTRPQKFKLGQCAQTVFGHASILLWQTENTPAFAIQVRWSYAQYLYHYLAESIKNTENLSVFEGQS